MSHSDTYFSISRFILVHQNRSFRSWYTLLLPGWIEYLERWALSRICFQSSNSLGTTNRFLNQRTPSLSWWKHWTWGSFSLSLYLILHMPASFFWAAIIWSRSVGVRVMLVSVPSATITRFNFSISWHRVACTGVAEVQLQFSFLLNASATTLVKASRPSRYVSVINDNHYCD